MFVLICSAISSHLQTCGCSVVVGSSAEKVNKVRHFLISPLKCWLLVCYLEQGSSVNILELGEIGNAVVSLSSLSYFT